MFIDAFYKLCKDKGVSANKACLEVGISRTSVAKWKNGGIPNGATILKFADYFNVTSDYLLNNEEKLTIQESSELLEIEKLIQDAKNRKANETMILKYSGGRPEYVILSDEEMKIIDVLIENAQNRQK